MQSAESALDAVEHLLGLSHRAAFIPSLSLGASRRQSGVFEVTGGILAATALTLPESSSVKSENNSSLALDAAVKRLSVNQYPPLDARTSESSSTFINSARSSSSLHRTSLSSTLGRLSGHRPSLSVSSRSSVMGSRSGSFLSTTASASYAQPPASMLDSNTTLLHARLNVKKVSHSNNVSSRPGPEPGPGILPSSSSTSIHSLALSTDGNGNGTAAEDVGNWPLTWVALSNTGTLTLFNPATRKTTVLALEGAVAVWDPWFYRPENEDEEEVPKAAPGCWHLWLPSPPYTKDYIIKGEHAREWVDAVNSASASAFFSTPAAQKVTVDQLCALVRIQNDKLASVRNVLLHMSLMKPLSGRSKKKVMEIVARKWVEARDAKRERERYAVLLSELEKRGGVGGPVRYGTI